MGHKVPSPTRFAALALAALSPSLFAAAGPAPDHCPAIDPPAAATPRIRVFLDPATGKRRAPTPDELRELAERRHRDRAASPRVFDVIVYPDGMRSVNLQGAFAHEFIVERKPDGTTFYRCVPQAPPAAQK